MTVEVFYLREQDVMIIHQIERDEWAGAFCRGWPETRDPESMYEDMCKLAEREGAFALDPPEDVAAYRDKLEPWDGKNWPQLEKQK